MQTQVLILQTAEVGLRIGVQIIGDDYANTPPVHELSKRGIVNVRGFRLAGDYAVRNPPAAIIEAVANGEIDVAVAWGPMAGYFAARQRMPLSVSTIHSGRDPRAMPLTYDIGMAVRKRDFALKTRLDAALYRNRLEIARILEEYHVPIAGAAMPLQTAQN